MYIRPFVEEKGKKMFPSLCGRYAWKKKKISLELAMISSYIVYLEKSTESTNPGKFFYVKIQAYFHILLEVLFVFKLTQFYIFVQTKNAKKNTFHWKKVWR